LFFVEEDNAGRLDFWEGRINTINKASKYYIDMMNGNTLMNLERLD